MGSEDFGGAGVAAMEVDAKSAVVCRSARGCSSFVGRNEKTQLARQKLSCSKRDDKRNSKVHMECKNDSFHVKAGFASFSSADAGSIVIEKTQLVEQKRSYSKRGDQRNSMVHMECKRDAFPVKTGYASFRSADGGNDVIGITYSSQRIPGQKLDIHDVTQLVGNLSLDELLDGSYKHPNLAKSNVRTDKNMNENIIQSVRKACSLLQLTKLLLLRTSPVIDSCSNNKISTSDHMNGDNGDSCITHQSSSNKDYFHNLETSGHLLDFPSYQPKDILGHLELPPSKKLEELLLDATTKAASRRNYEPRADKQISQGASLPPFPWSHASIGQSRMNPADKVSTSRKTCQGKWVTVGSTASCQGVFTNYFTDLESFTYDQAPMPSGKLKMGNYEIIVPSASDKQLPFMGSSPSWATCSHASHAAIEHGDDMEYQKSLGHCPRLLAAAETLHDMSTLSKQRLMGTIRWRSMKTCNKRSKEKEAQSGSDNLLKSANEVHQLKKAKLSPFDSSNFNSPMEGLINRPTTKSSRSSPSKSVTDSVSEKEYSNSNVMKQSCMMPPPAKILDKAYNSRQEPRKLVPTEWNRGRKKRLGS